MMKDSSSCRLFFSIMLFKSAAVLINLVVLFRIASSSTVSKGVLIVGAGPAGLSTALALQSLGWKNVTVIEKRSRNSFDSEKAYLYLVDGRGQRLTNLLNITGTISASALSSFQFNNLTEVLTTAEQRIKQLPVLKSPTEKFWLPRSTLLDVLLNKINEENVLNADNPINILFNTTCASISQDSSTSSSIFVRTKTLSSSYCTDEESLFQPTLLVGCDGLNSDVRKWLQENVSGRFAMQAISSDSAGLRYKMLTLRPRFQLYTNSSKTDKAASEPSRGYAIRSVFSSTWQRMSLGLLPVRGDTARTANIICVPRHRIWQAEMQSKENVRSFLQESFPQVDISDLVTEEEIDRFAKSSGGVFPNPQCCNAMYYIPTTDVTGIEGRSAVVIAGDTVHAFPPDLGQGVNSALEDVYQLHSCLKANPSNITQALVSYESNRLPEAKALMRLMKIGFPYQYNQAPIKSKLATMNVLFRLLLNKVLPSVFSPPVAFMIQDEKISYSNILKAATRTTRNILLSAAIIFALGKFRGSLLPFLLKYL